MTRSIKRITISMEEGMYVRLLEYTLARSKEELRNFSTSEAVRELLEVQLARMNDGIVAGGQALQLRSESKALQG